MVYSINQIKKIAVPIAKEYGVTSLSLFGSYAKVKLHLKVMWIFI